MTLRGDLECLWNMIVEGTACCPANERLHIAMDAHSELAAGATEPRESSINQVIDTDRFAAYWLAAKPAS